jgi:hypothetical protein
MKNTDSYQDRLLYQTGEEWFADWSLSKGYIATVFGSNARDNPIPNFSRLNPILRNVPDFVLTKDNKTYVVSVKGTPSIKKTEFEMLDTLVMCYSSDKAPFIYAFCFKGHEPVLMSVDTLKRKYIEAEEKQWHDGVKYRRINL